MNYIIEKSCGRCGEVKYLNQFRFRNDHNKYINHCKQCEKKYNKEYRKDKISFYKQYNRQYNKQYYMDNKKELNKKSKQYRENNKEKIQLINREYKDKNKNKIKKQAKDYYNDNKNHYKKYRENNKNKIKIKTKKWRENNKKHINDYNKNKLRTDINFKLAGNLRSRIKDALKNNSKSKSTIKLLGCTIPEFRKHLELLFNPEMSWNNHGTYWEIDHILPCSVFHLQHSEEQEICFAWWNMQPLECSINRSKNNKIL